MDQARNAVFNPAALVQRSIKTKGNNTASCNECASFSSVASQPMPPEWCAVYCPYGRWFAQSTLPPVVTPIRLAWRW